MLLTVRIDYLSLKLCTVLRWKFYAAVEKEKACFFVMQGIDIVKCLEDKLEKEVGWGTRFSHVFVQIEFSISTSRTWKGHSGWKFFSFFSLNNFSNQKEDWRYHLLLKGKTLTVVVVVVIVVVVFTNYFNLFKFVLMFLNIWNHFLIFGKTTSSGAVPN